VQRPLVTLSIIDVYIIPNSFAILYKITSSHLKHYGSSKAPSYRDDITRWRWW